MEKMVKKIMVSILLIGVSTQLFSFDAGLIAQGLLWMTNAVGGLLEDEETYTTWTEVKQWEDLKAFAGQLVAYQTNNYYLGNTENGYCLSGKPSTVYGLVGQVPTRWQGGEYGYEMRKFLKKGKCNSVTAFVDSTINNTYYGRPGPEVYVYMRLATWQEKQAILKAFKSEQGEFDYDYGYRDQLIAILKS